MKGRCSSLQAELEDSEGGNECHVQCESAAILIDYFLRKISQQAAAPASTRLLYLPMTQAPLLWQYQPWR